jgi:hypothetical protein
MNTTPVPPARIVDRTPAAIMRRLVVQLEDGTQIVVKVPS